MANPYFNAVYYLQNNPDVWAAGFTVDTAWNHYVQYGAFEANAAGGLVRAPNPWFDVKYYLTANPDLVSGGVTPATALDHFLTYGSQMGEDRAPNSAIAAAPITEASLLAYALANEDLQKAFGIAADATELTVAQQNQLVNQFYSYGYDESRPAAPAAVNPNPTPVGSTFTLTTGNDFADVAGSFRNGSTTPFDFKFTSANEVVSATTATMGNAGTNNDSLADGSTTDADVLNVSVTGNTTMATIRNIENINFNVVAGTAASTVTNLVGVTGLKTITLSGSPAGAIDLTNAGGYTSIGATGVTTIDASGMTTGGITVSSATATQTAALTITGSDAVDTITGGLGADTINGGAGADALAGGAGADTINGGAGNDFIQGGNDADTLNGDAGNDNIDGGLAADIINGGAGNDIIVTTAGNDTVTGGAGNDFIALGALGGGGLAAGDAATVIAQATDASGAFLAGTKATTAAGNNTVHLEASLADNGADVVTGFTMGATNAATGGDILNVSKFLGKAVTNYVEIGSTDGANNVTGSNVVVVTDGTLATAMAEAAGTGVTFGANAKTVVVEFQETTTVGADDNAVVRYVTTDSNGAVLTNDVVVTLVGVAAEATNNIAAFVADNFA